MACSSFCGLEVQQPTCNYNYISLVVIRCWDLFPKSSHLLNSPPPHCWAARARLRMREQARCYRRHHIKYADGINRAAEKGRRPHAQKRIKIDATKKKKEEFPCSYVIQIDEHFDEEIPAVDCAVLLRWPHGVLSPQRLVTIVSCRTRWCHSSTSGPPSLLAIVKEPYIYRLALLDKSI